NIGNIAAVAFSAVADKDFIAGQSYAEAGIIFYDSFVQEIIALLRSVATESFLHPHFGNGFLHRVDNGRRQRQGNVADTHTNNLFLRMFRYISINLLRDLRKQVAVFQITIVVIYKSHFLSPIKLKIYFYLLMTSSG